MDTIVIERSIWINAPRQRVWEAVTNPDQVMTWFVPNLPWATMKRDEDGKFSILMGEMGIDFMIAEKLDPLRQVVSRSLPDKVLQITYTFDDQQDGTQVTVTMTGFEGLPEDARQDRLKLSAAGWEQTLQNLKAYIDGADLPFPQAFVGPVFGYWREPREKLAIERSIWINALRQRVWQAITDPDQLTEWFSPGTKWQGTGLQVGGRFFVYDAENDKQLYVQVIDVFDPPHQLVTHSEVEAPEMPQITAWNLTEENGGTRLTLTHSGYELQPVDTRQSGMEQNTFGFGMMLQNIKAVVEGTALPQPQGF